MRRFVVIYEQMDDLRAVPAIYQDPKFFCEIYDDEASARERVKELSLNTLYYKNVFLTKEIE